MVVYIEKDVTDNTNNKTILSHNNFKISKLVKENFKNLYIWVCFYFVMLIYWSFIINKFFKLSVSNDHALKKLSRAATVARGGIIKHDPWPWRDTTRN